MSIGAMIRKAQIQCEEKLLREVIMKFTGEPFKDEDAPKITRAFRLGKYDQYLLAYDGNILGKVFYEFGTTFSVMFEPIDRISGEVAAFGEFVNREHKLTEK